MNKERIKVSAENDFLLTMNREGERMERMGIRNEYPNTELSRTLFQSLGLMYLISPYLPGEITTDFYVPHPFQNLIKAMYEKEGSDGPKFKLTDPKLAKTRDPFFKYGKLEDDRVSLTYSGGKDSMWNLDWLSREYSMKNVLVVHFGQMNHVASSQELHATLKQQKEIGFPLGIVDLLNSSKNGGKNIMRARDMFIVGVTVPLALDFQASKVFLEGGFNPLGTPKGEPFTTYEEAWQFFNKIFSSLGIPVEASWRDSDGMNTVRELITNRPDWVSLIYNCFSPECYKPQRVGKWNRIAPTFPLIDGQCGSCVKCRELNIARIKYDPQVLKAKPEDIKAYIKDTIRWSKEHKDDLADIIGGTFTTQLAELAEKYGV